MYRALDEWRGTRLAIWGSSLGFGVFHLGHGDPTMVVAIAPDLSMDYPIGQVQIRHGLAVALGYVMMVGVGIYLWQAPLRRKSNV
jgi:membrane protease YdiL (CAAX protease family)